MADTRGIKNRKRVNREKPSLKGCVSVCLTGREHDDPWILYNTEEGKVFEHKLSGFTLSKSLPIRAS